jgi:CheY-like chemotaxis protein
MQFKVLTVDNDPFLVFSLKIHFSDIGIEMEDAGNGIEAIEKIDMFEPDIILSEIAIPQMDGYELYAQLRKNPDTEFIPFIFLTAKDDLSDQLRGFRMGVDDYVCKPFEINDLIQRMQRAIERTEKLRSFRIKADFSGNISRMLWTDIFQLIELNDKTGELLFLSPDREHIGKTIFKNGRIVNAQSGFFEAEEAFYALITSKEGFFEFYSKAINVPPLIDSSNTSILLQGSRMIDEYNELLHLLPDLNMTVKFSNTKIPMEIEKSTDDHRVLKIFSQIHKKSTVGDILNSKDMSPIRAASILLNLLKKGDVETDNYKISVNESESGTFMVVMDPGLIEIIRNIERRLLTGILEFRNRTEPQAVYFRKGRIVDAFHGKAAGKKALLRIFREQGGNLKFLRRVVSMPSTVKNSLDELLQDAAIEIQKLQKVDKDFFTKKLTVNDIKVQNIFRNKNISELRNFIGLVHQHTRICDIIDHSPLTDGRTYDRINYLLDIGMLEFKE